MKTLRLLIILIGCCAVVRGTSFGESSEQAPEHATADNHDKARSGSAEEARSGAASQVEDYSAEEQLLHGKRSNRFSNKSEKAKPGGVAKAMPKQPSYHAKLPGEKPAAYQKTAVSPVNNLSGRTGETQKPVSSASVGLERKKVAQEKESNNPRPAVREQGVVPLGGPGFAGNRPRTSAPAFIGGPAISGGKGTAALNGTGLRNRSY
jgi:hypothetical protein